MRKIFYSFLLAAILLLPISSSRVRAQVSGPVYVVQSGDTLYSIALRFGITVDDLISANQLANPNQLAAGMELVIPGLEGITGKLVTETIPLGIDLPGLIRYRDLDLQTILKLNHITSYAEVYAGSNLILPQTDTQIYRNPRPPLANGDNILGHAAAANANPWEMILAGEVPTSAHLQPGEVLFASSTEQVPPPNPLSPFVSEVSVDPLPLVQGHTFVIRVKTQPQITLQGSLNGSPLALFPDGDNQFVALQGIYAIAEPGLASFTLSAKNADGSQMSFEQMMLLQQGYYAQDPPLTVDPTTIDPANTKPEDDLIKQTTSPATPDKMWDGIFKLPVDEPYCIKSWFGNRRSYNGGPYNYFHTGLDFGVCVDLNILAPAPGVVVFSGPLTVRGNATIINHGWGIYTGYWHQEKSLVKVGDRVETGQVIGVIGGTGRVTGPHLHWEVWVNGIQVEPQEWLDRAFP